MFSLTRRRREAERNKKLEEIFQDTDDNKNGKITPEQMIKIFEANNITASNMEEEISKLKDKGGWIKKSDFLKYAVTTDLCKAEFVDRVFRKPDLEGELKSKSTREGTSKKGKEEIKMDQVELAFRKFDLNKDGFISRDEFNLMMKDVNKEQADRIFHRCNASGTNLISLEEFRKMIERGKK